MLGLPSGRPIYILLVFGFDVLCMIFLQVVGLGFVAMTQAHFRNSEQQGPARRPCPFDVDIRTVISTLSLPKCRKIGMFTFPVLCGWSFLVPFRSKTVFLYA